MSIRRKLLRATVALKIKQTRDRQRGADKERPEWRDDVRRMTSWQSTLWMRGGANPFDTKRFLEMRHP